MTVLAAAARRYPIVGRMADVLDDDQRQAAEVVTGPVVIIAGAGTGKTRTVTHRIAHAVECGVVAADHVLALTFTARAAGELRERLTGLGVSGATARTFHSAALRQLQHFWPLAVGGSPPTLLEQKAPIVAEAASRVGVGSDRATIRDLAAEIEWSKVSLLTPAGYPAAVRAAARGDAAGLEPEVVARVIEAYEGAKTARGVMDFEDVLLLTTAMLERRDDIAAQVHARYRWFTVDEYQDVSAAQQRLLAAWVGQRRDVCVVGDPNQTIYTFAGADAALLQGFGRVYPDATVVHLTHNYRSTAPVVGLGRAVLGPSATSLIPARVAGAEPVVPPGSEVAFAEYEDEVVEADAVATQIAMLCGGGVAPATVAVLVRANSQLEALEQALGARSVPYLVRGGERFFARREVKEAITLLRGAAKAAVSGADDGDGRGRGTDGTGPDLGAEVRAVLSAAGWRDEAPSARGAVRQRWESLSALASHADRFATEHAAPTLAGLVADLTDRARAQHAPRADGITLGTLHAAKGLEWDVVFLPGLADGTMPISMATTTEQLAEERRLLYVGVTRAREAVRLSWSRARTPGGRATRRPSRFLDGIRPGEAMPPGQPGRVARVGSAATRRAPAKPPTCRSCGAPLATAAQRTAGRCEHCPPRYAPALFDALRSWRATEAAAAKVPTYVVFSDATLEAIAETHPRSVPQLVGISGVGAVKLERYGQQVLALVAEHAEPSGE